MKILVSVLIALSVCIANADTITGSGGGGGGGGDVSGPGSSTNTALASWNGTDGTALNTTTKVLLEAAGHLKLTDRLQKLKFVDDNNYITREQDYAEMIFNVKAISGDGGTPNFRFQHDGTVLAQIAVSRMRMHDIDLVWKTDNVQFIGDNPGIAGMIRPKGIFAGTGLYAPKTTEALPGFSFNDGSTLATSDTDTGFGSSGADNLFASTGGAARQRWTDSLTTILTNLRMNSIGQIQFGGTSMTLGPYDGDFPNTFRFRSPSDYYFEVNNATKLVLNGNGAYTYWGTNNTQTRLNTLARKNSATGNVGTGEDTLWSQAIAAGLLNQDGDSFFGEITIKYAANGNNKTVTLKYPATNAIATIGPIAQNDGFLTLRYKIVRLSSSSIAYYVTADTDAALVTTRNFYGTASVTLSSASALVTTGEGTGDNDVQIPAGMGDAKISPTP